MPFLTIRCSAPHLNRAGEGSVIVTASINGRRVFSNTGATAYSGSKTGQVAITKMLALELAKRRIRVNVVCPGGITTEITGVFIDAAQPRLRGEIRGRPPDARGSTVKVLG